ncbi:MAG: lamin tail domain-containing protein, partial [Chloroflexi bacterium]|nr:lamin tail domain-containing protein [Chloroflexota bacterium]
MRIQLLSFLSIISIWLVACTPTPSANILIDGVIYDGYELANGDELVILRNMGTVEVDLGGWQLTDRDSGTAVIPPNTRLAPQT